MKSSVGRGGSDQTADTTPASHGKTFGSSQEDLNKPGGQKVDSELHQLREALREAETRAKTQEEERKRALQKLQTSIETQSTLLNQIEEMNQRLSNTRQNQSVVQEQLSDANNKISQACLEKATLLTQVMKLEDNIKVLMTKQAEHQFEKEKLIKEKADLHQRNQVLDLQLKRDQKHSERSEDPESNTNKEDEENVQIRAESKALREVNEKLAQELEVTKQKLTTSQSELQEIRAERDVLFQKVSEQKSERSRLVREKEELLRKVSEGGHEELSEMTEKCCQLRESVEVLQSEKLKLQDQCLCLEAKVLKKEEKLQLQEEEFKRKDALRVQACEEQKAVASHWTDKWQKVALALQATQEELEDLKKNTLERRNDSESPQKVELDACKEEPERRRNQVQPHIHQVGEALQTRDAEAVTDLSKSSLLLEEPSDSQTKQNKLTQVKDEKTTVESKKDDTDFQVNPADQQRRLVTEQLKSLFKEREGKEAQTVDNSSAGAQTGAPPPQKPMKKVGDRRIWQHGSGLMPVFEEDEESCDCSGREDGELIKLPTEMFDHTLETEIINLKAEHENQLQAELMCKQQTADSLSDTSCDVKVPNIPNYSAESSLQKMRPSPLYPDGIFLAERVDICSPDEDEEEGVD
ncbi:uncharacterized protein LOC141796251 [Halichoeres trimaculatus]|uniref:uncharacterized protein LOC141796251 n=1 Tax=Halichoeres trimaculatus TaxID=147232 RepID=UPI003D9ED0A9